MDCIDLGCSCGRKVHKDALWGYFRVEKLDFVGRVDVLSCGLRGDLKTIQKHPNSQRFGYVEPSSQG